MGRRIAIFGALSAIARATAQGWAAEGASFVLVARDAERLRSVADDLRARGAERAEVLVADCAEIAAQSALVASVEGLLGQIDCALLAWGQLCDQRALEGDELAIEASIRTNFTSVATLASELALRLEHRGSGSIVVIGSVAGDRGRQSNYIYGAAKGALELFCSGLRNRLMSRNVRVLLVKPGFVDTPMTRDLPRNALFASAEAIGAGIIRAEARNADTVYLPWFWWWIMTVICMIPERFFKRLRL